MLATPLSPNPRKRSPALEAILSNLEAPCDDLLSGSECSSFVASPIEEMSAFSLEPQSLAFPHQDNSKSVYSGSARQQPSELILDFLESMMSGTDAAELGNFMSSDAVIESCGHSMLHSTSTCRDEKAPTLLGQGNLDTIQARCSANDPQIDSILSQGRDVAVFGHFACSDCSVGFEQTVNFSIWAEVDVERARIVRFRWLDQVVGGAGPRVDESERVIRRTSLEGDSE
jgi:hypothetical protein